MHSEVIAKIETLAKMSNSSNNANTLEMELKEIETEIKSKKKELKELKASMNDEKYFDASSEIVDKNIEISLIKKIKLLNKSFADLKKQISESTDEEEKMFSEMEAIKEELKEIEDFKITLENKINSVKGDYLTVFKLLLKETEEKYTKTKKELEKSEKAYSKLQAKIEVQSYSIKEIEESLKNETEKLDEIKANLNNKSAYINNDLKKEDQEIIEKLVEEIVTLEKNRVDILTDPVMIAEDAKDQLLEDNITGCLNKVKELKNIVDNIPYMDIETFNSNVLDVELENAIAKRDEYSSMINSKNYESVDTTLINDRINYLNSKKDENSERKEIILKEIERIDTVVVEDLNNRISYCEKEAVELNGKIKEFNNLLEDTELSQSKKISLQVAFAKKQEELNNINKLMQSYKNDRKNSIEDSCNLESVSLVEIQEKNDNIEKELALLNKLAITSNKFKDIISIENDKKTLKELTETVKLIKKRQGFSVSPSQLVDEIEILLGSNLDSEETNELSEEIVELKTEEIVFPDDLVIPEENLDTLVIDTILPTPIEEIEKFEEIIEPIMEEQKLKVVNVENLDENNETSGEDFLIGEYEVI